MFSLAMLSYGYCGEVDEGFTFLLICSMQTSPEAMDTSTLPQVKKWVKLNLISVNIILHYSFAKWLVSHKLWGFTEDVQAIISFQGS